MLRDIAKVERELDKAMNALARTQRSVVTIGEDIAAMHRALLAMKAAIGEE